MKVSEILDLIGKEAISKYVINWYNKDGLEVLMETEYEECVYEIFGDWNLLDKDAIYFSSESVIDGALHLYLNRKD